MIVRRLLLALGSVALVAIVGVVATAAFLPVTFETREELFEIPKGTWAARMAGNPVEILPEEIFLVVGMRDVLHLKNLDDVPQVFGPTLLMPGQSFRLPFDTVSENQFACTAHASGQLTVFVVDPPTTPWARLQWRTTTLLARL
jgi:hypothetical protein